jgi:hypothetical protein
MTRDPYDCCGKAAEKSYGRQKGKICEECAGLITDGKVARATLAEQSLAVYQWTSADYGWPRFYKTDVRFPHTLQHGNLHDELAKAFWALVNRVAVDAPADTPRHAPTYTMRKRWSGGKELERSYDPWPKVLSAEGTNRDSWSFEKLVLLSPATREALDLLHQTIGVALAGVYLQGKEEGGSVLHQLASGTLSLQDFDDALLTSEQRAAAQKARRGY